MHNIPDIETIIKGLTRPKRRERTMLHVHDYEITHVAGTIEPVLRCRCGDVAPNMVIAIDRMLASHNRDQDARMALCLVVTTMAFIGAAWGLVLYWRLG